LGAAAVPSRHFHQGVTMMRRNTVWIALALLFVAAAPRPARAQLEDNLGALIGENAKNYLQPLSKAMSATLNSAVFQTGHVPKNTFNLSLGVRVMGVGFGDASKTYHPVPPPGFTGTVEAPTVIGSETAVTQTDPGTGASIAYPGGFNINEFALAVPQLTIGSVFGTRAVVRWISVDLGNSDLGKFDYWGAGAQHSISQYFSGLPVDIAAGFFVQKMHIGDNLLDVHAWHSNVTASKRFSILEPYVGVGFDSFKMTAGYTADTGESINVKFDDETNPHFTAGIQALLGFARLQAEFNSAAETGAAVGLSLGRF
jgi:hypothetical protein